MAPCRRIDLHPPSPRGDAAPTRQPSVLPAQGVESKASYGHAFANPISDGRLHSVPPGAVELQRVGADTEYMRVAKCMLHLRSLSYCVAANRLNFHLGSSMGAHPEGQTEGCCSRCTRASRSARVRRESPNVDSSQCVHEGEFPFPLLRASLPANRRGSRRCRPLPRGKV